MSVEVWDTFKSSSRLNYIDNSLLPALARAYELVRKVQSLENDALKGFAYHPTNIRLSDGTATNGWLVILKQARSFDEALSDSVENALYLIEERLDNLNFFNS